MRKNKRPESACAVQSAFHRKAVSLLAFILLTGLVLTGMTKEIPESSARITVDGRTLTVRACGETVGALLEREGIILGYFDEMNCLPEDTVRDGTDIVIDRVEYVEKTTSEPVPFGTVRVESVHDEIGTVRVITEGRDGRIDTTMVEKIVNGETVSGYVRSTAEIPPVDEEILVGTALREPYSRREGNYSLENGVPAEYEYRLSGNVTAYTAPEGSGTYSGRTLEIGTAAVDPAVIPFGSELYICSKDGSVVYGYAIAADAGNLTDVIADVYMGTTREHFGDACGWGVQDAYVYVLSTGDNTLLW